VAVDRGDQPAEAVVGDGVALRAKALGQSRLAEADPPVFGISQDFGCGFDEESVTFVRGTEGFGRFDQAVLRQMAERASRS
jgi:hypothetical protein